MVDNKGWRKKIGSRPKDPPLVKLDRDDAVAAPRADISIELTEPRRHGWRKTIAVSRPTTPMVSVPSFSTSEEANDTRSVRSEASTPHRDARPKPFRYTSLFTAHKEEPAMCNYSEPWSVDTFPEDTWSYVDPIVIMESIHSHMCKKYMAPIPLNYNSGLFQIFDDYRKLRSQRDSLEASEREAKEESLRVTAQMLESEAQYTSEIRRLELLIAHGTNGMSGLLRARQDTVVDRTRQRRSTVPSDRSLAQNKHTSLEDVENIIREKSQQVLLQRSISPSGRMIALSQQLSDTGPLDLLIGTSPYQSEESRLSQKFRSELNLKNLYDAHLTQRLPAVITRERVEVTEDTKTTHNVNDALENDALLALRELGVLVARRKGLDVSSFISGLMSLLNHAETAKSNSEYSSYNSESENSISGGHLKTPEDVVATRPQQAKARIEPDQKVGQKRHRHFSFVPGDDHAQELEIDGVFNHSLSYNDSAGDASLPSSIVSPSVKGSLREGGTDATHQFLPFNIDVSKHSMIPSPVQALGKIRRESSVLSLQSVFARNIQDDRHDSRASVQTVFCNASSAGNSTKSKSRGSSSQNLRSVESPLGSKNRHSAAALAAARVADAKSSDTSRNSTRVSTAPSRTLKPNHTERLTVENNDPNNSE